jgi:predicted metal-dependent HD superfamily phosphohydrolase
MLQAGLSDKLTYHNIHHTLDVAKQCSIIAGAEGITDAQSLFELQVAALYHDTGFLFAYTGHEEKSCAIAKEQLPDFGLSTTEISNICKLIMVTKIPQQPADHLQQIICDADLDYLGRPDFFETAQRLQQELMTFQLISSKQEWEQRQLQFMQSHQYFTATSKLKRGPAQKDFLAQLNRHNKTA